jgi:hypothetical protein
MRVSRRDNQREQTEDGPTWISKNQHGWPPCLAAHFIQPANAAPFSGICKSPTRSGVPCLVAQMGWWSHLNATWVLAGPEEVAVVIGLRHNDVTARGRVYRADLAVGLSICRAASMADKRPTGLGPGALGAPRAINQASKQRFGSLAATTSIFISINVAQQGRMKMR